MSSAAKTCAKCGGRMEEGYLPEYTNHSSLKVSQWVAGAPEYYIFRILKLKGRRKLEVETWRCQRCGYLESYAPGS